VASMSGTPHEAVIDRFVRRGIEPAIVVPTFLMLPEVVAGTDLVAVLPSTLARIFVARTSAALQLVKLPVVVPVLDVRLYWAASAHRDPGLTWLREIVARCAGELASGRVVT